jgi:hypothetical protein
LRLPREAAAAVPPRIVFVVIVRDFTDHAAIAYDLRVVPAMAHTALPSA